jgi:hypothetical protein
MRKKKIKKQAAKTVAYYKGEVITPVYKALVAGKISFDEVNALLATLADHIEGMNNEFSDEPAEVLYQKLWLKGKLRPPSHEAKIEDIIRDLEDYKECFEEYPESIFRLDSHIEYLEWLVNVRHLGIQLRSVD